VVSLEVRFEGVAAVDPLLALTQITFPRFMIMLFAFMPFPVVFTAKGLGASPRRASVGFRMSF
jgi:hypothetical protein